MNGMNTRASWTIGPETFPRRIVRWRTSHEPLPSESSTTVGDSTQAWT